MKLTHEQIQDFHTKGYLLLPEVFSSEESQELLREMDTVIAEDCPRRILEKNGAVRSFFAPEWGSPVYRDLIRHPSLVTPAMQLLDDAVYVHQSKLNSKYAMLGDWWAWHQDYTFWKLDDGMPTPNVLTAMVFLNDVDEYNGPLLLIPGSHRVGVTENLEEVAVEAETSWFGQYQRSTSYMTALTADLKYTLPEDIIRFWARKNGIVSAKGPKGSVLFFHGNIFHASGNNLSPWDRHMYLVTYNAMSNALPEMENPRPEFIASRAFVPVRAEAVTV
jgi:ectoine hydroxylase